LQHNLKQQQLQRLVAIAVLLKKLNNNIKLLSNDGKINE